MRFNRSFVSGFETSGDRGPSPSPCFGSHGGAGFGGFCVLSDILKTTNFLTESKFTIAVQCPMTPKVSFGEHRVFVDRVVRELFDDFPRIRLEIRFREVKDDPSVPDDTFCLECSCTQFYAYNMHRRKLLEVNVNHLARLHA